MTSKSQPTKEAKTTEVAEVANELTQEQLDLVAGGKLHEAACKGTHIPEVTIE
jgi:hypothetical protein